MKKIITLIFLSITVFSAFAQSNTKQKATTTTPTKTDLKNLPADILKMIAVYGKENEVMYEKNQSSAIPNNEVVEYFEKLNYKLVDKSCVFKEYLQGEGSEQKKQFIRQSSNYKFEKFEVILTEKGGINFADIKFNTIALCKEFNKRIGKTDLVLEEDDKVTLRILLMPEE